MMRNDYRRSLIMLRTHVPGYSGHVRLERRTLMGTMYAVINAPSDGSVLCASLVRRNARGDYVAVKIGELRRDGRGQASLAYSFDPRNIEGGTLEDYWLVAIVSRDRLGRCTVGLSGNVNGSREVDWSAVQAAACEACRESECELCPPGNRPAAPGEGPLGPQTPALPPQNQPARPGEGPVELPTPSLPNGEPAAPGEGTEELPTPSLPAEEPAAPGEGAEELPTPSLPQFEFGGNSSTFQSDIPADDLPEAGEVFARTAVEERKTAAELLGLDSSVPWPGVSEQVRGYFASQPAKELMLGDGFTYVTAPMPKESGYDHVEVGLKIEDGLPVALAYALPSRYSVEPPPGLENYVWKSGAASGWWTIQTDVYTGERIV